MQTRLRQRLLGLAFGISLSILVLGGLELALRTFDLGPRLEHDPFAGFSNLVPMFERTSRDDGTEIHRTHPGRGIAEPEEFLATKPATGFRAFVVGGSSAAGTPYQKEHAFSGWLQQYLERSLPDLQIEVVNAAVTGYASRRIVAVAQELAGYEPDLLIVYSGHNEMGERRFYAHLLEMDPLLFRVWEWATGSRIFALLSHAIGRDGSGTAKDIDFDEIENANQMFVAGRKAIREGVVQTEREIEYGDLHYRFNLLEIISTAQAAGARVLVSSLTQNFSDWPPGSSTHRANLTKPEQAEWGALVARGSELAQRDCAAALRPWRQALAIDAEFAGLHYQVAGCLRDLERLDEAREHYLLASDLDRVLHGAPRRYNEILREVASETGALFIDSAALVEKEARRQGDLVGNAWVIDAMHPNIRTHQLIAQAIGQRLRDAGLPAPSEQWLEVDRLRPSPEQLYAERPDLLYQEDLVRGISCALAFRGRCAELAALALLAHDPDDPVARKILKRARKIIETQDR